MRTSLILYLVSFLAVTAHCFGEVKHPLDVRNPFGLINYTQSLIDAGTNTGTGTGTNTGTDTGTVTNGTISVTTTTGGASGTPGQEVSVEVLGPPNYSLTTTSGAVSQVTTAGTYGVTCGAVSGYNVAGSVTGQALAAGGTLSVTCAYTVAGPLFADNFDTDTRANWSTWYDSSSGKTITKTIDATIKANSTTSSLKISTSGMTPSWGVTQSLSNIKPSSVTFYFRGTFGSSSPVFQLLQGGTAGGNQLEPTGTVGIDMTCDIAWGTANIVVNGMDTNVDCATATWYKVELTSINYATGKLNVSIDGVQKLTDVSLLTTITTGFDMINLKSWGGDTAVWFDEIKMMP